MSNSIVITVPHNLGADRGQKADRRANGRLRRDYIDKLAYSEVNWNGDTADLRVVAFGQTVTGKICVYERFPAHRSAASLDPCRSYRQDPRRS